MRPSQALERHRDEIRVLAERHGVENVRIFGSVSRSADQEGSDLDLIVDPRAGTSLFDLLAFEIELEALLGVPVDVRTPRELSRAFREQVLAGARPL